MTAAFGGIIRDVLCGEIPLVLQREIYATAAAPGSIAYVAVLPVTESEPIAMALAFAVALSARAAGIVLGLSLPTYGNEQ